MAWQVSAPAAARVAFGLSAGGLSFLLLAWAAPIGVDWQGTFARLPAHWQDPYQMPWFRNPPWVTFLLPHALLPLPVGNAINLLLNIVAVAVAVRVAGGGRIAAGLALTSPFFFDLARTNNVDWIPLFGLLLRPAWGIPLIASKPQALGGATIVWAADLLRRRQWKSFLPILVLLALSLFWGFWIVHVSPDVNLMWNFAPFPFGLPLGIWLLRRALQRNDQWLGALATPFLVPYVAPYSVAGLLGIALARYPIVGRTIWSAGWVYLIVELRRLANA